MVKKKHKKQILIGVSLVLTIFLIAFLFSNYSLSVISPISEESFTGYFGSVHYNTDDEDYGRSRSRLNVGLDDDDDEEWRAWIDFDLTNVPSNAIIEKVVFRAYSEPDDDGRADSTEYYRGCDFLAQELHDERDQLWNALGNCKIYKTLRGSNRLLLPEKEGWVELDLGDQAVIDLQNNLLIGRDYFTIAMDTSFDGRIDGTSEFDSPSGSNKPYLDVDWAVPINIFRLQYSSCNAVEILNTQRTANDFDTSALCNEALELTKINVYRLSNNECVNIQILPEQREAVDFDSLEICEENKSSVALQFIFIISGIVLTILLVVLLGWLYLKFGRNKK